MITLLLSLLIVIPASLTTTQTARVLSVERKLLAPCCYTQSIAEHGSEVASRMRNEVAQMIAGGKSEDEVIRHYRAIYGDRILIVPDGLTGKMLFALPAVVFLLAFIALAVCLRRMRRSDLDRKLIRPQLAGHTLDDRVRSRIHRELGDSW